MIASGPVLFALSVGILVILAGSIYLLYVLRKRIKGAQFTERVNGRRLVAVVTGANGGIGRQLVRELTARNVTVYLLCRNGSKSCHTARKLYGQYGCKRMVKRCACDLSDLQHVRDFAATFNKREEMLEDASQFYRDFVCDFGKREEKLDILINNAGMSCGPHFDQTDDGHELVWQTNYLGHFLLTELLLPKLKLSEVGGRIINQSCGAHLLADSVDADVVNSAECYDPSTKTYARSKLAQVMHAVALAEKLRSEGSKVTINACDPGIVNTGLSRIPFVLRKVFAPLVWFFTKSGQDGAQTALHLALSKKLDGVSGKYFSECKPANAHPLADDELACDRLYNESMKACGLSAEEDEMNLL